MIVIHQPLEVIDVDFEADPEVLGHVKAPLTDLLQDAARFAAGEISRRDLQAASEQYMISVQELQEDCTCLHLSSPLGRCHSIYMVRKDCPKCNGRGWTWRQS